MRKQGFRFQANMLELIRKHSWNTKKKRSFLYRSIGLKPDDTVVDVGCGTGAFSRVVAQGLDPRKGGRVIGVDRNQELLRAAEKLSKNEGRLISFRRADALESLPFADDFADRVVCQAFLWLFDDETRERVIKEMIRICRPGGVVAAVEGSLDSHVVYIDGEPRLNELWRKHNAALISGYKKVYGYDRNVGYKLPTIFRKLGLERVRLEVPLFSPYSPCLLLCDGRSPLEYRLDVLRYWELRYPSKFLSKVRRCKTEHECRIMVEKDEPSLVAGGMSCDEIIEFMRLRRSRAQRLLGDPSLLRNDTSVEFGAAFLATGMKA